MELYGVNQQPILDPALGDDTQGNNVTQKIDNKIVMRPSSLKIDCPYKYAQSALLGLKQKPSGASQLGTSYHYAIELAFKEKLATKQNPHMGQIKDIAVVNWDKACETYDLTFNSKGDSKEKARDDIAGAVDSYAMLMPQVTPVAVETRFTVGLPKESKVYSALSGSIDLLALAPMGTSKIVDHKLTGAKKNANDYRMQTGLYEIMAKSLGHDISSTELHNAVRSKELKTKTRPVEQHIINPTRDKPTFDLIQARITELINRGDIFHYLTIEKAIDPAMVVSLLYPTTDPQNSYLCSEDWCGFWFNCPNQNPNLFNDFSILDLMSSDGVS